jgi:hypothetical protein
MTCRGFVPLLFFLTVKNAEFRYHEDHQRVKRENQKERSFFRGSAWAGDPADFHVRIYRVHADVRIPILGLIPALIWGLFFSEGQLQEQICILLGVLFQILCASSERFC